MKAIAIIAGVLAAATLTGTAMSASAQSATPSRSRAPVVTLAEANAAQAAGQQTQPQRRGLRLTRNGRWGLDFNLTPSVGRESDWGDVEAGAYYSVNPRLRVGAAAGLASPAADPAEPPQVDRRTQPRVRLESTFRF